MGQNFIRLVTENKKLSGFFLIILGIGTAILAQITLLSSVNNLDEYFVVSNWLGKTWNNTSPLPGMTLYALAGVVFALGVHTLGDLHPAFPVNIIGMQRPKPKFGFWISSFGLAVAIALHTMRAGTNDTAGFAFAALWILSIILFVVCVLVEEGWHTPSVQERLAWFKKHRAELFVIATILVAAFFVRFLDLELHPYAFNNDEAQMGSNGICIFQGTCTNFFDLGWAKQARVNFLPYGLAISLLGTTAFAVRLTSVFTGTLSVLAVYLFAREVFDSKIAWLSALLLAMLPFHIQFSRTGVGNIVDSLSAPLILWLLFRGIKRGSTLSFLAAGIVAGMCLYIYPGSLLAPVLAVGTLAYISIRNRGFIQAYFTRISFFVLIAILIAIPLFGYFYAHPNFFLYRMKAESIFQNDSMQNEIQVTGRSTAEILTRQFARSSLVYIATDAPGNFFNSPKPYLLPIEAILFMLGMAYILWRIKDLPHMVLFIWFWAVIILGSTITSSPPSNQRLLMSTPPMVMIIAIGITKTLQAITQFYQPLGRFGAVILLALILYSCYTNLNFYFYDYRVGHYAEDVTNELTYETRLYTAPLHTQGRLYLLSNPSDPYLSFPSFNFFAPDVEKFDFHTVTRETLAALPNDKDALFIATPEYKSDMENIARWVPGGEWNEFKRRYQPIFVLFYAYKITKEQLEGFKP